MGHLLGDCCGSSLQCRLCSSQLPDSLNVTITGFVAGADSHNYESSINGTHTIVRQLIQPCVWRKQEFTTVSDERHLRRIEFNINEPLGSTIDFSLAIVLEIGIAGFTSDRFKIGNFNVAHPEPDSGQLSCASLVPYSQAFTSQAEFANPGYSADFFDASSATVIVTKP